MHEARTGQVTETTVRATVQTGYSQGFPLSGRGCSCLTASSHLTELHACNKARFCGLDANHGTAGLLR